MTAKNAQQIRNDAVDGEIRAIKDSIAINTQITSAIRNDVAKLRTDTQPVIDAMQTMDAGIRTIGHIGNFGIKIGKFAIVVAAVGAGIKMFFGGASWSEVTQAFYRSIGK